MRIDKRFSRLGRNSARGLDYIDEYFPAHDVRYISVTDGYDSLYLTNGISMAAPMMMFVNEMYARDISNKIKSAFQIKMKRENTLPALQLMVTKKIRSMDKKISWLLIGM